MMPKASELLRVAEKQVGMKESPPSSNNVRYNTWYYGREVSGSGYPWCMVFVQWCADQTGVKLPRRTASCGELMRAAQAAGQWVTKGYRPGDVAIFDFPGGAATDHCGIIVTVSGDEAVTIEGNTAIGNDPNGGEVMVRSRKIGLIRGAVRPEYEAEEENGLRYNTITEIQKDMPWAVDTIQKLIRKGGIKGSGKKDAQGLPADMDLSRDMIREFMVNDQMGLYGK